MLSSRPEEELDPAASEEELNPVAPFIDDFLAAYSEEPIVPAPESAELDVSDDEPTANPMPVTYHYPQKRELANLANNVPAEMPLPKKTKHDATGLEGVSIRDYLNNLSSLPPLPRPTPLSFLKQQKAQEVASRILQQRPLDIEEINQHKKEKQLSKNYATYYIVWVFVLDQKRKLTPQEIEQIKLCSKTTGHLIKDGIKHAVATVGYLRRPSNQVQHEQPMPVSPAGTPFGFFAQPQLTPYFPASQPVLPRQRNGVYPTFSLKSKR